MSTNNIYIKKFLGNTKIIDKFFISKKFTENESSIIRNIAYTLYFDNSGNIALKSGNIIMFNYKNPFGSDIIYFLDINQCSTFVRLKKFIMSPNLIWILYDNPDDKCFYMMYNFIHTIHFRRYYLSNNLANMNQAISIFNSYCKLTEDSDYTCSCLPENGNICVKRFLSDDILTNEKNKSSYQTLLNNCQYIEPGCSKYKSLPNSFLRNYYNSYPFPDSININVCSNSFTAGKDINMNSADIQQQCNQEIHQGNVADVSGTTSPEITKNPLITTTPDYSGNNQNVEIKPTKSSNPGVIQESSFFTNNWKLITGIAFIILSLIAIKIFILDKKLTSSN